MGRGRRRLPLLLVAALALALALGAACGGDKEPTGQPLKRSKPAWKEFSPEEENFVVAMPGTPRAAPSPILPESGVVASSSYALLLEDGVTEYFIGATRLAHVVEHDGDLGKLYDGGRDGFLRGLGARKLDEREATLERRVGREIDFETEQFPDIPGKVVGRAQIFIVGDTVYQLGVAWAAEAPVAEADQVKFFASFRLKRAVVKPKDPALVPVEWEPYAWAMGGFTALAPARLVKDAPNYAMNPWNAPTAGGGTAPTTFHVVWFKVPHRASVYAVRFADLPPKSAKLPRAKLLDAAIAELSQRSTFEAAKRRDLEVGELAGVEVEGPKQPEMEYDAENVWHARARFFIVGQRLYEIMVAGPRVEYELPETQLFLDSLRVEAWVAKKK